MPKNDSSGVGCALLLVGGLAIFLYNNLGCSSNGSQTSAPKISASTVFVPEIGKIYTVNEEPMATDEDSAEAREKFAEAKDQYGISDLMGSGRVWLAANTQVRAIDLDVLAGIEQVRVESGNHIGEIAYVPAEWLRP